MKSRFVILVAAATAICGTAFVGEALRAAANQERLSLSITPTRQTAPLGGSVSFSVNLERPEDSTDATSLRIRRLPKGVRARWQVADGKRTATVPPGETGAVLTLRVSRRARLGTRRLRVIAKVGTARDKRGLTLSVVRRRSLGFSLSIRPAAQTVAHGGSATYALRIARGRGFRGRVALRTLGAPRGVIEGRRPRKRRVTVAAEESALGSQRLVVRGTSRVGGRRVRRYAVAVLTVLEARAFEIAGHLESPLHPGAKAPLDLELTNPHPFDIFVSELEVSVRSGTSEPGCSGADNYAVTQYSGPYPLTLHPGTTHLSSSLEELPHVRMRSLAANQDACQGAVVTLDYEGLASR